MFVCLPVSDEDLRKFGFTAGFGFVMMGRSKFRNIATNSNTNMQECLPGSGPNVSLGGFMGLMLCGGFLGAKRMSKRLNN